MDSTSWLENKANFHSRCKITQGFSCCVAGKKIHSKPFQAIAKLFYERTKIPQTVVDFRYDSWVKPPSASVQQCQCLCFIYVTVFEADFGLLLHCEYETQD